MGPATNAPVGYRGTRGEILTALKMAQPLTAKELADRFGVTPNALRRHLKELELEGIVRYQREIRGVGGPVFAFSLTDAGEALFPRAYENTLSEVLDLVRQQNGEEELVRLFQRRWDDIAAVALPELERLPVDQRATRLAELLTSLGYMAESHPVVGNAPGPDGTQLRHPPGRRAVPGGVRGGTAVHRRPAGRSR